MTNPTPKDEEEEIIIIRKLKAVAKEYVKSPAFWVGAIAGALFGWFAL